MKGIKNSKYSVWIIAFVFALSIFAQSLLFHYLIYHEILFSTLWHSPEDFQILLASSHNGSIFWWVSIPFQKPMVDCCGVNAV